MKIFWVEIAKNGPTRIAMLGDKDITSLPDEAEHIERAGAVEYDMEFKDPLTRALYTGILFEAFRKVYAHSVTHYVFRLE